MQRSGPPAPSPPALTRLFNSRSPGIDSTTFATIYKKGVQNTMLDSTSLPTPLANHSRVRLSAAQPPPAPLGAHGDGARDVSGLDRVERARPVPCATLTDAPFCTAATCTPLCKRTRWVRNAVERNDYKYRNTLQRAWPDPHATSCAQASTSAWRRPSSACRSGSMASNATTTTVTPLVASNSARFVSAALLGNTEHAVSAWHRTDCCAPALHCPILTFAVRMCCFVSIASSRHRKTLKA